MTPDEALALAGHQAHVRVYDAAGLRTVMAEGRVIGYAPHPSLLLQHDDGSQSQWMTTLPIEEIPVPETKPDPLAEMAERMHQGVDALIGSLDPSKVVDWTMTADVDEQPDLWGDGHRVHHRLIVRVETYEAPRRRTA